MMNEFTKEELELIGECVEADFYHTNWSKSMYEPLVSKIQSMIDNYCKHEYIEDPNNSYYQLCINCGDTFK